MSLDFAVGFILGVISLLSFIVWNEIRTEPPTDEDLEPTHSADE